MTIKARFAAAIIISLSVALSFSLVSKYDHILRSSMGKVFTSEVSISAVAFHGNDFDLDESKVSLVNVLDDAKSNITNEDVNSGDKTETETGIIDNYNSEGETEDLKESKTVPESSGDCLVIENTAHDTVDVDNDGRRIPRNIHLILPNKKCVKPVIYERINQWRNVPNYSVIVHDEESIYELFNKERPGVSSFSKPAQHCALSRQAMHDLAKVMLLWDYGGIVVSDLNLEPSSLLLHNISDIITDEDELILEVDSQWNYTRSITASVPEHPFIFSMMVLTINKFHSHFYTYITEWSTKYDDKIWWENKFLFLFKAHYPRCIRRITSIQKKVCEFSPKWYETLEGNVTTATVINKDSYGMSLVIDTRISDGNEQLQPQVLEDDSDDNQVYLSTPSDPSQCVDLNDTSYYVNLTSLREVFGADEDQECVEGLKFLKSYFPHNFTAEEGRKIPKIVHLTSKSKCLTPKMHLGLSKWYLPDYAVMFHDDDAVERLFEKDWPMFPLMKEVRSCITTGAGKADLWRYLVIWEYGGIYTDIDNGIGKLINDTLFKDEDALFEVERGGFPSQYFFAASPHHPVMYYTIQNTISRLLEVTNVHLQYVPFVTGPGAVKTGVYNCVGDGYPAAGRYDIIGNRSLTMVGRRGKNTLYVQRDALKNKDSFAQMNMTHYSNQDWRNNPNATKMYECYGVLYEDFMNYGK